MAIGYYISVMAKTGMYTLIYQTGGHTNAQWHKTLLRGSYEEMRIEQLKQYKAGRNAYIKTVRELETIGMPEGYRDMPKGAQFSASHTLEAMGVKE